MSISGSSRDFSDARPHIMGESRVIQLSGIDRSMQLRRRLLAELGEIDTHVNQCDESQPVANCLRVWSRELRALLGRDDLDEVLHRFNQALESIFEDPMNAGTPFHPDLYSFMPDAIVRFMIGKMRDRHSLFFSERVDDAAPADALSQDHYRLPEEFVDQMREIHLVRLNRRIREEKELGGLQALRDRISRIELEQNNRFQSITRTAQEGFDNISRDIDNLRDNVDADRQRYLEIADQLQQEADQLREETIALRQEVSEVRTNIDAVERSSKELQIAINEVREQQKRQKSGWFKQLAVVVACVAISWACTWAIGLAMKGMSTSASVTASGSGAGASLSWKF